MKLEETGEFGVSIENTLNLANNHGLIVGIIFRLNVNFEDEDTIQSTQIFYWDGMVHEALGFFGGNANPKIENELNGFLGLVSAIHLIPFLPQLLTKKDIAQYLCNKEDIKKAQKEKTSLYYVFRPPEDIPFDMSESLGYVQFLDVIEYLYNDNTSKVIELLDEVAK